LFLVILALCVGAAGCSRSESPEEVTLSFFKKMKAREFDDALQLATQKSQPYLREIIDLDRKNVERRKQKNEKVTPEEIIYSHQMPIRVETGEAVIKDNHASVPVFFKRSGPLADVTMQLEKENGQWKIVFVPPYPTIHKTTADNIDDLRFLF
jgi:hypothetical protein